MLYTTKGLLGNLQANTYRLFHFWCCHLRSVKRRPDPERLSVNRPNELGHVVLAVYIRVILLVKVEGAQGEGEPADSTPETASGKEPKVFMSKLTNELCAAYDVSTTHLSGHLK